MPCLFDADQRSIQKDTFYSESAMAGTRPGPTGPGKFILFSVIHLIAITLFINGYLLTRIHLPDRSEPSSSVCDRPYKKLVWIIIDALRLVFYFAPFFLAVTDTVTHTDTISLSRTTATHAPPPPPHNHNHHHHAPTKANFGTSTPS